MRFNLAALRLIDNADVRLLKKLEAGHKKHEYVPVELNATEQRVCSKLAHMKAIHRQKNTVGGYSYRIARLGFDFLALQAFKGIAEVGVEVGKGKEADVHFMEYLTNEGETKKAVIKFHRMGRTSFKSHSAQLAYANKMLKTDKSRKSWQKYSEIAAEWEQTVMKQLKSAKINVPEVIYYNRHIIVMEYLDQCKLLNKVTLPDEKLKNKLAYSIMKAYTDIVRIGYVHGDYNEFNLLLDVDLALEGEMDKALWVIDFAQTLAQDGPHSYDKKTFLKRDLAAIDHYTQHQLGFKINDSLFETVKQEVLGSHYRGSSDSADEEGSRGDDSQDDSEESSVGINTSDEEETLCEKTLGNISGVQCDNGEASFMDF